MTYEFNADCSQCTVTRETGIWWWRKTWRAEVKWNGSQNGANWGWSYAVSGDSVDYEFGKTLIAARVVELAHRRSAKNWVLVQDLPAARLIEGE